MTKGSSGPLSSGLSPFLSEQQDPALIEQVHTKVTDILTSGEDVLYMAVQQKPLLNVFPNAVVLTTRRFIIYRPALFGRVRFEDYIWLDLHDAKLREDIVGATISMKTVSGASFFVDYLPKVQARRLYSIAQEMEEKVREERRLRDLQDKRAAAGGVVVHGGTTSPPTAALPVPAEDPVQKLKQLKSMLDAGLITEAEYDSKKAEILSRL
jgi:hypothetical protein